MDDLTEAGRPMSLTELSGLTELGKASTLRLVRTLEDIGLLVRDPDGRYRTDGEWPSIKRQRTLRRLRAAALPVLSKLNAELGETVTLGFLFDDHVRVLEVLESPHHIRMSNFRGRILQPYASSVAKAIAAFQTPERIQLLVDVYGIYSFTPHTITDPKAIQEEFAAVRERGYSQDLEESVEGGVCFGAPIAVPTGEVVAAVSVSQPVSRLTDERRETLPGTVKKSANSISMALQTEAATAEVVLPRVRSSEKRPDSRPGKNWGGVPDPDM